MAAWVALLASVLASTQYKKGLVTTPGIPAAPFSNLGGVASWLYNYNVIPSSKHEVDFLNDNNMEFIAHFGGTYAQTELAWGTDEYGDAPTGWPLVYGTNRRCYTWSSELPVNPNNEYYGSSLCTKEQLIEVINASNAVLNVPVQRIMLWNEPYEGALYEENATETAHWYKDIFQEVVTALGLKVTSATTSHSPKALDWDETFLKTCMDLGCDLSLIDEWSIHKYNTKQQFWEQHYTAYTGTFYTAHEALFSSGYGSWSASQWQSFIRNNKLRITEHSAEQETETSFGMPDNQGTCARYTTQFGGPSTCVDAACAWGNGSVWWMLQPEQTNVIGIVSWPMCVCYIELKSLDLHRLTMRSLVYTGISQRKEATKREHAAVDWSTRTELSLPLVGPSSPLLMEKTWTATWWPTLVRLRLLTLLQLLWSARAWRGG